MSTHDLPTHPFKRHPLTDQPLRALGWTKGGNPIWPVIGASHPISDPAPVHIPGLITASGTTPQATPPAPTTAQPGTPAGTVTNGQLPGYTVNVYGPAATPGPVPNPAPAPAPTPIPSPAPAPTPQSPPAMALPTVLPGLAAAPTVTTTAGAVIPTPTLAAAPPAAPPAAPDVAPEDRGYPPGTPLEQMTVDQREAYWKYHARQWEHRAKARDDYDAVKAKAEQYDQHLASQATETEQKVSAARQAGYQEALAAAAITLVDAHVRAGLQTRLQPHQVEALAANLNHQHFLTADGRAVDADKVATFVQTVAPTPVQAVPAVPAVTAPAAPAAPGALPTGLPSLGQPAAPATGLPRAVPDLGQGSQSTAPLDKLEMGRLQAEQFLAGKL